MAIGSHHTNHRIHPVHATHVDSPASDPPPASNPPRARRSRRWLMLLSAVLLLVAALPWLVAHSPLCNYFLNLAIAPEQGRVTAEGASLGWFSALSLRDVEIQGPKGETLLKVAAINSDKSLLGLLFNQAELGRVQIAGPEVFVKLRADGSNLEDFAAPWLAPSDEPTGPLGLNLVVEVTDGKVHWQDTVAAAQWELTPLQARLALASTPADSVALDLSATNTTQPGGTVQLRLQMPVPAAPPATATSNELSLATGGLPLEMLQTLLARYLPGAELSGRLTSQLKCTWQDSGELALDGGVEIKGLALRAAALGEDRLELAQLNIPCQLAWDGERVNIEELGLHCDVGTLQLKGSFPTQLAFDDQFAQRLAKESFSAQGQLDLVKLSALLPRTLHLRPDTRLTSGAVELRLHSYQQNQVHRWQGRLLAKQLAAVNAGRQFAWEQPVEVALDAHLENERIVVDNLTCQSDFLELSASGTPQNLRGDSRYDLNRLVEQLEQVVDFGGWQLSGNGEAEFVWSRQDSGVFNATAKFALQNFQLAGIDRAPWIEEQLIIEATAGGTLIGTTLHNVRTASLLVTAQTDRLDARLRGPITSITADAAWPLTLQLQGELARWLNRARPFFTPPTEQLAGQCDLNCDLTYSDAKIQLEKCDLLLTQFVLRGLGLQIDEPQIKVAAQASWQMAERRLDVPELTLASSALSLRAESMALNMPENDPPALSGLISVQGAVERLQRWMEDPAAPSPWQFTGTFVGQAKLTRVGDETTAQCSFNGKELRLVEQTFDRNRQPTSRLVWTEPKWSLDAAATHKQQADQLQLHKLQLTSKTATLDGTGTIEHLAGEQRVDLSGTLNYNLAQVMPLLEPYTGQGIRLEGQQSAPFTLKGPLAAGDPAQHWSRRLAATIALGWQKGEVYGMAVGPAKFDNRLGDGALTVAPFEVAVAEGKFTSAPVVRFDPEPAELQLGAGPLLSQVRISPEICDRGLKYIAPVLADATRCDGRFSVTLEGGRIPLAAPATGDLAGRLTIHQVEVLPGPLAQQFLMIGKLVEAAIHRRPPPAAYDPSQQMLMTIQNQNVDFRLVQGRVYHRGLEIKAGDAIVRTHGSVGLDQTLAILAEVPIQDKWIGNDPAARALKGQTIEVAITGTLQRPKIDRRSIEQLAAQMLRGAAQEVISNELNKQLDKLFKPKK